MSNSVWECDFFLFLYPRAPVLVAIALIEYGMKYSDAVEYIRQWVVSYGKSA